MKPEDLQAYTVSHPKKRGVRFFAFDSNDVRWSGVYIALALVALSTVPNTTRPLATLGALAIWALTMAVLKNDMRLYYMPFYWQQELKLKRKKGRVWTAPTGSGKKTRRKIRPQAVLPLEVHAFDDIGLIYNRLKNTDSLVFTAPGSTITTLGIAGQYATHHHIADMIRKAAATAGSKIQISMGVRARPESRWGLWDTVAEIGEVEVVIPEAELKEVDDYTNYDKRMLALKDFQIHLAELDDCINDVDMVFVVTVRRPEAFRQALKAGSIDAHEVARQPIMRIKNLVIPTLEKILGSEVRVLDANEAELYLRKAWDVADLGDYYDHAHRRLLDGPSVSPDQWFPARHITVAHNHVQIDGTYSSTLIMNAFPTSEPYPFEPRSHYDAEARWFAHGVIGETVNGGWEYGVLNTSNGLLTDLVSILGIQWTGPKVERREEELNDRLREIDRSTFTESFNVLASVSETSEEALEEAVRIELDRLTAEGRAPMLITGMSRQLPYFITASTLIDVC